MKRWNNMKKETRKELKISLIIVLSIILVGVVLTKVMYLNSSIACGKIVGKYKLRGRTSLEYNFNLDDEIVTDAISIGAIKKDISFDSIKKIECLKIEYSNYSTFFSRVVDDRVLNE